MRKDIFESEEEAREMYNLLRFICDDYEYKFKCNNCPYYIDKLKENNLIKKSELEKAREKIKPLCKKPVGEFTGNEVYSLFELIDLLDEEIQRLKNNA